MTASSNVVRRFLASRPVPIDKTAIRRVIEMELVPQIRRWLKSHPEPDKPIGKTRVIASGNFHLQSVDQYESLKIKVSVLSKPATGKWASVLGGAAGKREFENGEATVEIDLYINGAISPTEYLTTEGPTVRFQPLGACRYETCLPYGLYSILIHEATHAAEVSFNRPTYKVQDGKATDYITYVNDPGEVRAFIQQIVDEVVGHTSKIKDHFHGQKLVSIGLRMSTIWKAIEKDLTPSNRNKILKAVYQAMNEAYLV